MEAKQIARLAGLLLSVVIFLLILSLNAYGLIKLAESIGDLWFILLTVLATISFQLVVWPERFLPHSKGKAKAEQPDPFSLDKGLLRQSQRDKVSKDLQIHYENIIGRMENWDYQPRYYEARMQARRSALVD
jgi:hypothetical protein